MQKLEENSMNKFNEIVPQQIKFLKGHNHNQQTGFKYISWCELVDLVSNPPAMNGSREQAKASSEVIAAHDASLKTKEVALSNDNFTLLRLDIDDTQIVSDDIADELERHGIKSYLIHTTASHKQEGKGNRYRVYIELGESLTYKEWATLETYLSSLFRECDDCAARPAQIMYLPFSSSEYEFIHSQGESVTRSHSIFVDAKEYESKLNAQQTESRKDAHSKGFKRSYREKLVGSQMSIINIIEASYCWETLLTGSGYKRKGKAWLAPESSSGIAGAYLLKSSDGKTRFYSHHSNDPCATGRAIDKADFIAIREFNGDTRRAIKTIARDYFPAIHEHNLKEWKINRLNGGK